MIIPEDTPETPKAQTRARELVEDSEIPASSPPAYPGHESGSYQAGTSSTQPLYIPAPLEPVSHTEPAGKRFFKAFGIALLIWFLLVSFTGSVTEVGRSTGRTLRVSTIFNFYIRYVSHGKRCELLGICFTQSYALVVMCVQSGVLSYPTLPPIPLLYLPVHLRSTIKSQLIITNRSSSPSPRNTATQPQPGPRPPTANSSPASKAPSPGTPPPPPRPASYSRSRANPMPSTCSREV